MRSLLTGAALALLLSVSGCINVEGIVTQLAKDNASFCGTASAWGGAGAVAVGPAVVPSGGAGSASFTFCRTNTPNTIITKDEAGTIRIIHGWSGEVAPSVSTDTPAAGKVPASIASVP